MEGRAMSSGYSATPLPKKLGIKEGHLVATVSAPADFGSTLGPIPSGVTVRKDLRGNGPFDVIVVFVRSESELRARFEKAREKLSVAGGLWVAWPKQSSDLATRLKDSDVRSYGLSTGLVDNKVCAIDEDWSGLRFVVRTKDRPKR
jgi:hypothetical protein